MSINILNWVWDELEVESPIAKLLLLDLADQAGPTGFAYPSIDYISRRTKLARRTIYKYLEQFRAQKLVEPRLGVNQNGYEVEGFQFNLPEKLIRAAEKDKKPISRRDRARGAQVCASVPQTVHDVHSIYRKNHQEPLLNLASSDALRLTARAESLQEKIGKAAFDAWFGDVRFLEETPVQVIVPSQFKRNWIVNKYLSDLQRIFGDDVRVELGA